MKNDEVSADKKSFFSKEVKRIESNIEAFYSRLTYKEKSNNEFYSFYHLQFLKYCLLKNNSFVSKPEGDMISDLILSSYLEAKAYFDAEKIKITKEGRENILMGLEITFPCQNEPDSISIDWVVSK